jgi:hypothetical protein
VYTNASVTSGEHRALSSFTPPTFTMKPAALSLLVRVDVKIRGVDERVKLTLTLRVTVRFRVMLRVLLKLTLRLRVRIFVELLVLLRVAVHVAGTSNNTTLVTPT